MLNIVLYSRNTESRRVLLIDYLLNREVPIFTTKAHVFLIDPVTKKSWIPASKTAIPVNFFFDSSRQTYRIISVEGSKVR